MRGRGLTDDTIRSRRLGFRLHAEWVQGLSVPAMCVTIPWYVGGELWQVKVRQMWRYDDDTPKYKELCWPPKWGGPCGQPALYGADTLAGHDTAILCEGELDAAILHQEAGHLAAVCTLGSCAANPPVRALRYLLPLRRIILACDTDAPGRAAAERLKAEYSGLPFERAEVPAGKDATEFSQRGGNLREWVLSLLG